MPRGIEALPIDAQAAMPPTVASTLPAEQIKEPEERALFLIPPLPEATPTDTMPNHQWEHRIQRLNFNHRFGTLLLELNSKKTLPKLIDRQRLDELQAYGFIGKDNMHITALGYANGRRIIRALGGKRRRLKSVVAEASDIDWSWSPSGEILPLQSRRSGRTKLVALVDCPGALELYDRLEEQLPGLRLDRDPQHITMMRLPGELRRHSNAVIGGVALAKPLRTLDHLRPNLGLA